MSPRVDMPDIPPWLAALPFLCGRGATTDQDLVAASALGSAASALAADVDRRDSRSRLCFLLSEFAAQYGRRTGRYGDWIPVSRAQLANAARISLPKVKRVLGFLILSSVVELRDGAIRIVDWQRLCRLGAYDRSWLSLPASEGEDDERPEAAKAAPELACTAAGDPASFV